MSEADLAALSRAILPKDIFKESSCSIDTKMQRFDDVITNRIELPHDVTAKKFALKICRFLDSMLYDSEYTGDCIKEVNGTLAEYGLGYEDCFYKLAKHNPEIAVNLYFSSGEVSVCIEKLLISDNIEVYSLLIKEMDQEADFIIDACTYEELEMLIDRLGAERMLKCCEHMPELVEKIKEITDNPLVKCAAKVT
jgi:hypothetical protein